MSGYEYQSGSDEFGELEQNNSGGSLRKILEETLAENRKLRERLEKEDRAETATALLKDKGLDPALVGLIPEDADPKEWVDKYAPLLGAKEAVENLEEKPQTVAPEVEVPADDDPALVAEREALAEMRDAQESGFPAAVSSDLLERMDKISDEKELLNFFQTNGGVTGG